jgi:hypothetical protein
MPAQMTISVKTVETVSCIKARSLTAINRGVNESVSY